MNIECIGTFLTGEAHDAVIRNQLIPQILKVIEDSGISCHEATTIPAELESAIEANLLKTMGVTKFSVQTNLE